MIESLSIIIPFYNEEKRIKKALEEIDYYINYTKLNVEIIFVDDGSNDNSKILIEEYIKQKKPKFDFIKLVQYEKNKGKGYALKQGVLGSRLAWILTTDIDFSVSLNEISIWEEKKFITKNCDIFFGSRQHKDSVVNSKIYRDFLGGILRIIINFILGIKMKDTQCGFKLYKKDVAKIIFNQLKVSGFEHDLEIVMIAKKENFKITELPITWTHKEFSKLNIFIDPIKMFFGGIVLKFQSIFKLR